jgi:hypothetical protein
MDDVIASSPQEAQLCGSSTIGVQRKRWSTTEEAASERASSSVDETKLRSGVCISSSSSVRENGTLSASQTATDGMRKVSRTIVGWCAVNRA